MKRKIKMKKLAPSMQMNEQGSALVIALIILVLLTLIGISATTTTQIETQIAGNERAYMREFYVADSSWKHGVGWINNLAGVPTPVNFQNTNVVPSGTTDFDTLYQSEPDCLNVRNFGDEPGSTFDPTNDIPINNPDGILGKAPHTTNYWYKVGLFMGPLQTFDDVMLGRTRAGLGPNERDFDFIITGDANQRQEIGVTITKLFVTGSASGY